MGVAGLFFKPGPYKFEKLDILERKKMIFFFQNILETLHRRVKRGQQWSLALFEVRLLAAKQTHDISRWYLEIEVRKN